MCCCCPFKHVQEQTFQGAVNYEILCNFIAKLYQMSNGMNEKPQRILILRCRGRLIHVQNFTEISFVTRLRSVSTFCAEVEFPCVFLPIFSYNQGSYHSIFVVGFQFGLLMNVFSHLASPSLLAFSKWSSDAETADCKGEFCESRSS